MGLREGPRPAAGFSLLTSLRGWRPPTGQSPPTTNLGLARWPLEAPRPSLPGLCSAPPLKPPLPGSQESTASPAPATSGVFPGPLWDPSTYVSSGPDTWPSSPPMLILGNPSTAPPLPGPSPALVSTSSRLQPGRATDTALSWSQTTQMPCPNLTQRTTLWTVSACGPSSTLTSAAQPWSCSNSQDPAPHQPGRASSRQPSKCPCTSDLLTGPLTQRAKPRSSQEPGLHPSRANSTNRRPPTLRPQPAEPSAQLPQFLPQRTQAARGAHLENDTVCLGARGCVQDLGVAGHEVHEEAQVPLLLAREA